MENRIIQTKKLLEREKWYYAKYVENPADIPTRFDPDIDLQRWHDGAELKAVARRCYVKKVLSEISRNSRENTDAGISFFIKL